MKNPLVSIITTNYNKGKYLEEMLNSILNQDYNNIEHNLVDDCSDDNSKEILKKYEKNKNVIIDYKNKNVGYVGKLRNKLVEKCSGKYILNVDSDDVLYQDAVSILVDKAEKDSLDVCYGSMINIDELSIPDSKSVISTEYIPGRLIKNMYIPAPRMYKRELFYKTLGYLEKFNYGEDWFLYLQLEVFTKKFGLATQKPLLGYRVLNNSVSNSIDTMACYHIKNKIRSLSLKFRNCERILFIFIKQDYSILNNYRKMGYDVCSLSFNGNENISLEEYKYDGTPLYDRNSYKIKFYNFVKTIKLLHCRREINLVKYNSMIMFFLIKFFLFSVKFKKITKRDYLYLEAKK